MEIFQNGAWLPLAFAGLMALAIFVYAVLDGFDIGVGILMNAATEEERDTMMASIGPFWDANETWLVLAVGLLLIAFPKAHGVVLTNLYLPAAFMLFGLILRGVSFDFRAKAKAGHKNRWDKVFQAGSFLMALCQGYMIGAYVLGFKAGAAELVFCLLMGLAVVSGYCLIGASWLIMKTEGVLQKKAVVWARNAIHGTAGGVALIALALPMISVRIFDRWFSYPNILYLIPIPVMTVFLVTWMTYKLKSMPLPNDQGCWVPFVGTVGVFLLSLIGAGYSFYPYIIPDQMLITEAAAAPESLLVIFIGAMAVLPFLIGYSIYAYKVFHGKTREKLY